MKCRTAINIVFAVVTIVVLILAYVMIWVVPSFIKIFDDFQVKLPAMTVMLINISNMLVTYWYLLPGILILIYLLFYFTFDKEAKCQLSLVVLLVLLLIICLVGMAGLIAIAVYSPLMNVLQNLSS